MKISIIGTGYVGLVTGVCFAKIGHEVICVEKDRKKVKMIEAGEIPIYEPGLKELFEESKNDLSVTTDLNKAVKDTDISFICVGTPTKNKKIDLGAIKAVSEAIGKALKEKDSYHVVVVKSTVVPGTTSSTVLPLIEKASGKKPGKDFGIAMNPEFLREGVAVKDFMNPDRIVIGSLTEKDSEMVSEIYKSFNVPIITTNTSTAEMIKYASNSFLATTISFSNEIANICETLNNVDEKTVLETVGLDKRINPRVNGELVNPGILAYLSAGCGFGGSCFPKDVKALINFSKELNHKPTLLESVIKINNAQAGKLMERVRKQIKEFNGKKIAVLGLAFKQDTDDMRESPSIRLINALLKEGASIQAYDPKAIDEAKKIWKDKISYEESAENALKEADACFVMTAWPEFKEITPETFKQNMKTAVVADGRRLYDPKEMSSMKYVGVGLNIEQKKKALVIGGSGQVGGALTTSFSQEYDVFPTYSSNAKPGMIHLDITDPAEVKRIFSEINPDVVLLAAARVNVDFCEENKEAATKTNVEGTKNIVNACKGNCKMVYVSSDYVFDGKQGPYSEDATTNPAGHYGVTKLEGEKAVSELSNSLIARTTVVYDHGYDEKNFLHRLVNTLKNNQQIKVPNDQIGTPTYATALARAIYELVQKDKSGLFNIVGPELMNRYEFAIKAAEALNLNKDLILSVASSELNQKSPRPKNLGLKIDKLKNAGISMMSVDESLKEIKEKMKNE